MDNFVQVNACRVGDQFKVEDGLVLISLTADKISIHAEESLIRAMQNNVQIPHILLGLGFVNRVVQDQSFNEETINWLITEIEKKELLKAEAANQ
jgi:hypothetical protein